MSTTDKSNGYEAIAPAFINSRGKAINGIGASSVRRWARTLWAGSLVLDAGCGTGIPVSKVLREEGMVVYGVDASPGMVQAFRQNFPGAPVACEAVEDASFFDQTFDGIISWGLMFLLPEEAQATFIRKAAAALNTGGKFLFTSPAPATTWNDIMTGLPSLSLGAKQYNSLLSASGLSVKEEWEDEGENHYYDAVKM